MATTMDGLILHTLQWPQICQTAHVYQDSRDQRFILTIPGLKSSNLSENSVQKAVIKADGRRRGEFGIRREKEARAEELRWRRGAVAEVAVMERNLDAKKMIDEVLRSKGGDGSGGVVSASWALYADQETTKVLADAVDKLGASRGQDFRDFMRTKEAQGVWEVFYAPHISTLSRAIGTQVNPLHYKLSDSGITSNVRYWSPILGGGWLSAAGDFVVKDGQTVEVLFDSFWWDIGRDNLQPDPKGKGSAQRFLVNVAGRGAFIPALSVYPVYYADSDIVIFEFTTLRTKIAARKVSAVIS